MPAEPRRHIIDVSWSTLLKVLAFVVGLYLITILRDILFMLFVVFIFVAAVNPTIVILQRRFSRVAAVTVFFITLLAFLLLIGIIVIPALFGQLQELARAVPSLTTKLNTLYAQHQWHWLNGTVSSISSTLSSLPATVLQTAYTFAGSLAITATGLVLSVYLLLEERSAKEFFHQILPAGRFQAVYLTVSKISERMGQWVRSQLLLMLIIGVGSLLAYLIIGVPQPLALGLWSGLAEAVPVVGPILGILPALLITASTLSLVKVILLLLTYFGIQQLESHVVVPRVMGKALGLSPVLVILALLIGDRLFGPVGILVAVPTAAAISVIVGEWSSLRRIWSTEAQDV